MGSLSKPQIHTSHFLLCSTLVFLSLFPSFSFAKEACGEEQLHGKCYDKPRALILKIISIFAILVASLVGVCLPLFTRSIPALHPEKNLFVVVKAFASGVILATAFMHVLPDSYEDLGSPCLPENPWSLFPFTGFVSMLSAIFTLMVDSLMTTFHKRKYSHGEIIPHATPEGIPQQRSFEIPGPIKPLDEKLARNKVIAQVLELGIVVHSVIIGLSMGASQNVCTVRTLAIAICFHQMFEGMGLGGCILQGEFKLKTRVIMVFFFSFTTPFGLVLGIALSNVYSSDSPTALIVVGLLNASSAGLLIYMALVDLLAADFLGPKLQSSATLQCWAYLAVLLGAGGMSLMAKWA